MHTAYSFRWDVDADPTPAWELKQPWLTEEGMSKRGILQLTYYCGEGKGKGGCCASVTLRKALCHMVLVDEDDFVEDEEDDDDVPSMRNTPSGSLRGSRVTRKSKSQSRDAGSRSGSMSIGTKGSSDDMLQKAVKAAAAALMAGDNDEIGPESQPGTRKNSDFTGSAMGDQSRSSRMDLTDLDRADDMSTGTMFTVATGGTSLPGTANRRMRKGDRLITEKPGTVP
jgi:hypothetical protein